MENNEGNNNDIASEVHNKILKRFIANGIKHFSDFLRIEEKYILDKIELNRGIGKNSLIIENVFLLFVSVTANINI